MTDNEVTANLPTFQQAYHNANKAYRFVIYDAKKALNEVSAGSNISGFLIPRYSKWCQKELSALKSEIESGMYKNCQTDGLREIQDSLEKLIEAFQEQKDKYRSTGGLLYDDDVDDNQQNMDCDMLIDHYARMNIG